MSSTTEPICPTRALLNSNGYSPFAGCWAHASSLRSSDLVGLVCTDLIRHKAGVTYKLRLGSCLVIDFLSRFFALSSLSWLRYAGCGLCWHIVPRKMHACNFADSSPLPLHTTCTSSTTIDRSGLLAAILFLDFNFSFCHFYSSELLREVPLKYYNLSPLFHSCHPRACPSPMLLEHGMCSGPLGTGLYTLWQLESVATEASQTIGFPAMSELVYFREEGSRDPTSSWKDWRVLDGFEI